MATFLLRSEQGDGKSVETARDFSRDHEINYRKGRAVAPWLNEQSM
jgi:hypothetical protein